MQNQWERNLSSFTGLFNLFTKLFVYVSNSNHQLRSHFHQIYFREKKEIESNHFIKYWCMYIMFVEKICFILSSFKPIQDVIKRLNQFWVLWLQKLFRFENLARHHHQKQDYNGWIVEVLSMDDAWLSNLLIQMNAASS